MKIDYRLHLTELPISVEGVTVPNPDGSFDIYINSLLPVEKRELVLEHELKHILREHFYVDMPVSLMERQADGESINVVLHPPEGMLPVFHSEDAFLSWLRVVTRQQHLHFPF